MLGEVINPGYGLFNLILYNLKMELISAKRQVSHLQTKKRHTRQSIPSVKDCLRGVQLFSCIFTFSTDYRGRVEYEFALDITCLGR